MNRTGLKKKKFRSKRRCAQPTRGLPPAEETTPSTPTQSLRILAQIAMLKRALLAAEDEGLPHKAICDYLHTLSQMAKLEPTAATADGESELDGAPVSPSTTPPSASIRERLRLAIADIYGISELPSNDPATPLTEEPAAELGE